MLGTAFFSAYRHLAMLGEHASSPTDADTTDMRDHRGRKPRRRPAGAGQCISCKNAAPCAAARQVAPERPMRTQRTTPPEDISHDVLHNAEPWPVYAPMRLDAVMIWRGQILEAVIVAVPWIAHDAGIGVRSRLPIPSLAATRPEQWDSKTPMDCDGLASVSEYAPARPERVMPETRCAKEPLACHAQHGWHGLARLAPTRQHAAP